MQFEDLIERRYSVRSYDLDRDVEEEKIAKLLEAARMAPTAANRQAWRIVVVRDDATREAMSEAYMRKWFYTAPVIIAACGIPSDNWVRSDGTNYNLLDVGVAMDHLILQAAELGLGTCWIADFKPDVVRRVLGLPTGVEPVALTPVGYPTDEPKAKKRRPTRDLVYWERWGD